MSLPTTLPHDPQLERDVLGAALLDDQAARELAVGGRPELFYLPAHARYFDAVRDVALNGSGAPTVPLVIDRLRAAGVFRRGDAADVDALTATLPDVTAVPYTLARLRVLWQRRELVEVGQRLVTTATTNGEPEAAALELSGRLSRALSGGSADGAVDAADDLDGLKDVLENGAPPTVAVTGLRDLDRLWKLRVGSLNILAGSTGGGKTATALQAARSTTRGGGGVLVASLEMTRRELFARAVAAEAGLTTDRVLEPRSPAERDVVAAAIQAVRDDTAGRWRTLDHASTTVTGIRAQADALRAHGHPLDLIVIDYLQLMPPETRGGTRDREVSELARRCKVDLAMALEVPVLLLSQLNRAPQIDGRAPDLRDLRESGAIEQHADTVLMLHPQLDPDERHTWNTTSRAPLPLKASALKRKDRFGRPGHTLVVLDRGGRVREACYDAPEVA